MKSPWLKHMDNKWNHNYLNVARTWDCNHKYQLSHYSAIISGATLCQQTHRTMENQMEIFLFIIFLSSWQVGKPATKIHVWRERGMCLKVSLMDNLEADCGMKYNSMRIVANRGLIWWSSCEAEPWLIPLKWGNNKCCIRFEYKYDWNGIW